MRPRAALAIAFAGPVLAPLLAESVGFYVSIVFAATLSAVGIALWPERS